MAIATLSAQNGYINGNFIGLTYVLITLAELWVSAIGLSMIGLYCDMQNIAFAMGVWYLASSLSNAISGRLASLVAIPENITSPLTTIIIYKHYYLALGGFTLTLGIIMFFIAHCLQNYFYKKGIQLL